MDELNFDHQLCTFHLEKHLWKLVNKEANKIAKKYRAQLKKENLKCSKTKLNKMRDEKKKEFKEEMREFIELFMAFKDQKTWKKAQKYIEMLKRELINFPVFLQEYLMKNFVPYYKKYIKFLTKEYKGKLDNTDNKLENYFGNTLNKHIKKIFRTKQGLFNFIFQRKMAGTKQQISTKKLTVPLTFVSLNLNIKLNKHYCIFICNVIVILLIIKIKGSEYLCG